MHHKRQKPTSKDHRSRHQECNGRFPCEIPNRRTNERTEPNNQERNLHHTAKERFIVELLFDVRARILGRLQGDNNLNVNGFYVIKYIAI